MENFYNICNTTIRISAPVFPDAALTHGAFLTTEANPDINITVTPVDVLPEIEGLLRSSPGTVSVYESEDTLYRVHPMGTDPGSITVYKKNNPAESETFVIKKNIKTLLDERYFWNTVSFAQIMLSKKVLFFHASFIEINGQGIIFSAPSGTGKSTQAALWKKHRQANIINGDKAGVMLDRDNVYVCGVPFCGTSGICQNRIFPLKAIVLLEQAEKNSVKKIRGVSAVTQLMQNIHIDLSAPSDKLGCIDLLIGILSSVPVIRLSCTPEKAAVDVLGDYLKI